jgi:hypothetical protein
MEYRSKHADLVVPYIQLHSHPLAFIHKQRTLVIYGYWGRLIFNIVSISRKGGPLYGYMNHKKVAKGQPSTAMSSLFWDWEIADKKGNKRMKMMFCPIDIDDISVAFLHILIYMWCGSCGWLWQLQDSIWINNNLTAVMWGLRCLWRGGGGGGVGGGAC